MYKIVALGLSLLSFGVTYGYIPYFSILEPGVTSTTKHCSYDFSDVQLSPYTEIIQGFANECIIKGVNNKFHPKEPITKRDLGVISTRIHNSYGVRLTKQIQGTGLVSRSYFSELIGYKLTGSGFLTRENAIYFLHYKLKQHLVQKSDTSSYCTLPNYSDIQKSLFKSDIEKAKRLCLVEVDSNTVFGANDQFSKKDFLKVLMRGYEYKNEELAYSSAPTIKTTDPVLLRAFSKGIWDKDSLGDTASSLRWSDLQRLEVGSTDTKKIIKNMKKKDKDSDFVSKQEAISFIVQLLKI